MNKKRGNLHCTAFVNVFYVRQYNWKNDVCHCQCILYVTGSIENQVCVFPTEKPSKMLLHFHLATHIKHIFSEAIYAPCVINMVREPNWRAFLLLLQCIVVLWQAFASLLIVFVVIVIVVAYLLIPQRILLNKITMKMHIRAETQDVNFGRIFCWSLADCRC